MPDILHRFPVRASARQVFDAMTLPTGLDNWWTLHSTIADGIYQMDFGPGYLWRAAITHNDPNRALEWTWIESMDDWLQTRVGFTLSEQDGVTTVDLYHSGWREASEHFRVSSYCWAMYLRLLRRYVESGEVIPYARRLNA